MLKRTMLLLGLAFLVSGLAGCLVVNRHPRHHRGRGVVVRPPPPGRY